MDEDIQLVRYSKKLKPKKKYNTSKRLGSSQCYTYSKKMVLGTLLVILVGCTVCCSGANLTLVETNNWKNILNELPSATNSSNEDLFDTILRNNANARSTGQTDGVFLFQGDIEIPDKEAQALLNNQKTRVKRAVIKNNGRNLWRPNIPYAIAPSLGSRAVAAIRRAVRRYEQVLPCLGRWIDVTRRRRPRNYMNFFRGSGCYSYVGFIGGAQRISIGRGCDYYGIVIHEIGHALGLWHEQSRPDRDRYVRIHRSNIIRGMAYNFDKQPRSRINSLGVSYDFGSIMHYGPRAFSRNGRPTITKLNGDTRFGQRRGLSQKDIIQLQSLYKCNRAATTTKPTGTDEDKK